MIVAYEFVAMEPLVGFLVFGTSGVQHLSCMFVNVVLNKTIKPNVSLPDGENLTKVKIHVIHLSDKDGSHSLVEGGAIHVDGGTHR